MLGIVLNLLWITEFRWIWLHRCIFWISGLECKVCPTESRVTSKRWQVCRRISVDGGRDQKSEGLSIQLIVLPSLADGAAVTNRI